MLSRHILELCTSSTTIISEVAKEPDQPISRVARRLSKNQGALFKQHTKAPPDDNEDELGIVAKCGRFPRRPSDLFLQIYCNVLHSLETHPLVGLVSPSLIGTSGVIPLSIVSVIPDIMRHYADLIVRAEAEILLATNYWELSASSSIISDSLRELSKRVDDRGGPKVVMKLMYDRGNVRQAVKHRIVVNPVYWSKIGLPNREDIPGVNLEVINYHRPLLGTFHAKYLVIDRRVACLNSNNVQDRPNIEMMVQLEGPIVDSIYDVALLSWSNAMNPPLPLLSKPPWAMHHHVYKFYKDNESLKYIDQEAMSRATRAYLTEQHAINEAQRIRPDPQPYSGTDSITADQKRADLIAQHPSMKVPSLLTDVDARDYRSFNTQIGDRRSEIVESDSNVIAPSSGDYAKSNAKSSTEGPASAGRGGSPRSDTHTRSRSRSSDSAMRDKGGKPVVNSSEGQDGGIIDNTINCTKDAATLPDMKSTDHQPTSQDDDGDAWSDFLPHIFHDPHQPVPIAMVNRLPTGRPGHYPVRRFPQDVAWLSAMCLAEKSVFIQTPTFNASPIVASALDACRRGVRVTLYLDLGFNDQGEMIPFQGGTNEEVVHRMYTALNSEGNGAEKNLEVFWYTSKDQTRPLNAALKKRNCHIKFMAVDDQIAILGNGNQDTQSWFHSQEVNIMVDSPELVGSWLRAIDANQNTRLYGRVSDRDGVWRSEDGEIIQASGVAASSFFKRLKGLYGVMRRISGSGKF